LILIHILSAGKLSCLKRNVLCCSWIPISAAVPVHSVNFFEASELADFLTDAEAVSGKFERHPWHFLLCHHWILYTFIHQLAVL